MRESKLRDGGQRQRMVEAMENMTTAMGKRSGFQWRQGRGNAGGLARRTFSLESALALEGGTLDKFISVKHPRLDPPQTLVEGEEEDGQGGSRVIYGSSYVPRGGTLGENFTGRSPLASSYWEEVAAYHGAAVVPVGSSG